MNSIDDRMRPGAAQWLLLALLFAGATALFTQLLRPLAAPEVATAIEAPARIEPVAPPAPAAPAPLAAPTAVTAAAAPAPAPVPAPAPAFDGPRIAIVLTDVGDNPAQARAAIEALPPEVGLAFTPYPDVLSLARAARADGHEIWAGVPMQPKSWPRVSPGNNTLLVSEAAAENVRRLDWTLARVGGLAVGITGIMGSAFTENAAALRPVFDEAGRRNLTYLDARASGRSVGVETARAVGIRAARNDRFLDESGSIAANLAALEQQAKREGKAIGYARPLPGTVAALQAWAATLEEKGIRLAPPSTLAE